MTRTARSTKLLRVLAVDPSPRGFGFAVLEGPARLIDWGVAELYSKDDKELLVRIEAMVDRYRPTVIVLEDTVNTKRRGRGIRRIRAIAHYVRSRRIRVVAVSRSHVQAAFKAAGTTKHNIAVAIVEMFPELEARLPKTRTLWTSEDERMNIFDAVAFGLTVPLD